MQAINRKSIACNSLSTDVNDTAIKKAVSVWSGLHSFVDFFGSIPAEGRSSGIKAFPSSSSLRPTCLLHSRPRINVCCFPYFLSSVHTNLLMPVPIHLALFGGIRDYIAQKNLEPSLRFLRYSHMFSDLGSKAVGLDRFGYAEKLACWHLKPIQVSRQNTANELSHS